jgi:hypothetical protein
MTAEQTSDTLNENHRAEMSKSLISMPPVARNDLSTAAYGGNYALLDDVPEKQGDAVR